MQNILKGRAWRAGIAEVESNEANFLALRLLTSALAGLALLLVRERIGISCQSIWLGLD